MKKRENASRFELEKPGGKPIYRRIWFWAILVVVGLLICIPTPQPKDKADDATRTIAEANEETEAAEEGSAEKELPPEAPAPEPAPEMTAEDALALALPVAIGDQERDRLKVDRDSGEILDTSEDAYLVQYGVSDWYEGEELGGYYAVYWVSRQNGEVRYVMDLQDYYEPGMVDMATGAAVNDVWEEDAEPQSEVHDYILNTNKHRFHRPDCASVSQMSEKNKQAYTGTREDLIAQGYDPCDNCNP